MLLEPLRHPPPPAWLSPPNQPGAALRGSSSRISVFAADSVAAGAQSAAANFAAGAKAAADNFLNATAAPDMTPPAAPPAPGPAQPPSKEARPLLALHVALRLCFPDSWYSHVLHPPSVIWPDI